MTSFQSSTLNGQIQRETEKALLISFRNGRETWVPKSIIKSPINYTSSTFQEFTLPKWFLEEKNLILEPTNKNIIGESGSEAILKARLMRTGIEGFQTMEDILYFKNNSAQIIASSSEEEREKLNTIIESLKTNEEKLIRDLEEKKAEYAKSLINEKEELLTGDLTSKDEKRVKKIDKILERKIEKPFRKDKKQIKKTEKQIVNREKNIDKRVEDAVKPLKEAGVVMALNKEFIYGAVGENAAINELKKLPESYFTINEAFLSFSKAIRWKQQGQYVKSCKIDHVVVGPTGIFLIETKNWSPGRIKQTNFTPHMQIDRAGYIFFIHMMDKFNRKFPVRKVVATYRPLAQIPYKYVDQMIIKELPNYILETRATLGKNDILKIAKWLKNNPHINNARSSFYFGIPKRMRFRF